MCSRVFGGFRGYSGLFGGLWGLGGGWGVFGGIWEYLEASGGI